MNVDNGHKITVWVSPVPLCPVNRTWGDGSKEFYARIHMGVRKRGLLIKAEVVWQLSDCRHRRGADPIKFWTKGRVNVGLGTLLLALPTPTPPSPPLPTITKPFSRAFYSWSRERSEIVTFTFHLSSPDLCPSSVPLTLLTPGSTEVVNSMLPCRPFCSAPMWRQEKK